MISWVIGSGGLLGSAIRDVLRSSGFAVFAPPAVIDWRSPEHISEQTRALFQAYADAAKDLGRWIVYWAAGIGTMASNEVDLMAERSAFSALLAAIKDAPGLKPECGTIVLASSAGALHVSGGHNLVNELTTPTASTPYAWSKLRQEEELSLLCNIVPGLCGISARISSLYGPARADGKKQGLIAHMARCVVRNKPISIFVPLDTMRDYVTSTDAARMIVMSSTSSAKRPGHHVRIIASERPTSVAELVSEFKRAAHRPVRIVTATSGTSSRYPSSVRFRSMFRGSEYPIISTPIRLGVADTLAAERARYARAWATPNGDPSLLKLPGKD